MQILRRASGNVQPKLNVADIGSVKVPKVEGSFFDSFSELYEQIVAVRRKSKSLYSQAETMLLEELDLAGEGFEDELTYVVDYSDVAESDRIDADYFQPKYEKLISKLESQDAKPLLEILVNVSARFTPQNQPDQEFNYVELANIDSSIGVISGSSVVLGREAPSRARRLLKPGDVIVSSIAGSIEKAALVDENYTGALASTGFFQFRSDTIQPEVLLVLAKSVVLRLQLERETTGTILPAVPNRALERIAVPILPKPTQQKISDLVRQSHAALKESQQLLEKAKQKVEEMIEKGSKME